MGGFSVGDLYAKLRLDIAEFQAGLASGKLSLQEFTEGTARAKAAIASLQIQLTSSLTTELEEYRALIEAERIRDAMLTKEYAVKTDLAALTAKLRDQETKGIIELNVATNEGFRQEAAFRATRDAERTASELDYHNLVTRLRAEEVAGQELAMKEIEAEVVASEQLKRRIQAETAAARRAEIAQEAAAQRTLQAQTAQTASILGYATGVGGFAGRAGANALFNPTTLTVAAGALSIYEVAKFTIQAADAARATHNLGEELNISWIQARQLEEEARVAGISINSLTQASGRIAESMDVTSTRGKQVAEALRSIGVDSGTSGERLVGMLEALTKIGDASERIGKLREIVGRGAAQLEVLVTDLPRLRELLDTIGGPQEQNRLSEVASHVSLMGVAWDRFKASLSETGPVNIAAEALTKLLALMAKFNNSSMSPFFSFQHGARPTFGGGGSTGTGSTGDYSGAQEAADEYLAIHRTTLEGMREELKKTQEEVKKLDALLGTAIPLQDRVKYEKQMVEDTGKELNLALKIKEAEAESAFDPGKAAAKAARQDAALSEAQTALSRYADAYNSEFQLLTGQQRAFVEGSFDSLNQILSRGAGESNLSTFRAKLASYSESLKRFATDAKQELSDEKITEALDKMSDRLNRGAENLTTSQLVFLSSWLGDIRKMVTDGLDPRLIDIQVTALNDRLTQGLTVGGALGSEVKTWAREVERAFKMVQAQSKETDKDIYNLLTGNGNDVLTRLRSMGGVQSSVADFIEQQHNLDVIGKAMGFRPDDRVTSFQNMTMELIGQQYTPLIDKQRAVVAMFEEMSRTSGISAEQISRQTKFMIDGVVQDYDTLKAKTDKLHESFGSLGRDLNRLFTNVTSNIFELLVPNKATQADPLQPLVAAFRGAFEKLSAYANPKGALTDLVASIQMAGDQSTANAIAVKYFGDTAGPLLASELRSGTYSVGQITDAINKASLSTTDYANNTVSKTSAITKLWQQLEHDVVVVVLKQGLELAFKDLIGWLAHVETAHKSLAQVVAAAWNSIWASIRGTGGVASVAYPTGPPNPPGSVTNFPQSDAQVAATIAETAAAVAEAIALAIDIAAVTANTAAVSTNTIAIAAETRGVANSTLQDLSKENKRKADEILSREAEQQGTLADGLNTTATNANTAALLALTAAIYALILKLGTISLGGVIEQFVGGGGGGGGFDPFGGLFGGWGGGGWGGGGGWNPWDTFGHGFDFVNSFAGGGSSSGVHVHGPVTVMANDPDTFVRKLKQLRVVKGIS